MKIGRTKIDPEVAIYLGVCVAIGVILVVGCLLSPSFASFVLRIFYKFF